MSSETVQEVDDEQPKDTAQGANPSVFKLQRWQWATILALAVGQSLTMVAFSTAEMAGAFVGAGIGLYLFAVLFRFIGTKIGWEDNHGVFAKVSVLAAVVSMPFGIMLIPPVSIYLVLTLIIYIPLQVLILGGGLLLSARQSDESTT